MKRTFFLILLFFCALFVKADVLGPYTMDSNVPPTPTGYARVVLPIGGADASVAVSITVCDESGQQYVLRTTTQMLLHIVISWLMAFTAWSL